MSERPSLEYLCAFVDGELTPAERERVLRLMEQDPAVKTAVCEVRTLKEMVRLSYPLEQPQGHAPLRLRNWRGLRQALAAGLILACGLGLGWIANEQFHRMPGSQRIDGLPAGLQPVSLNRRVDPDKLVLHVDSGERAVIDRALTLAESLSAQSRGGRQVEIVVHSAGLDMLRADVTPFRERILRLAARHANLSFIACGNTIARLQREGKTVVLLPVAKRVDSAVGEIVQRLQQGWVYIKV